MKCRSSIATGCFVQDFEIISDVKLCCKYPQRVFSSTAISRIKKKRSNHASYAASKAKNRQLLDVSLGFGFFFNMFTVHLNTHQKEQIYSPCNTVWACADFRLLDSNYCKFCLSTKLVTFLIFQSQRNTAIRQLEALTLSNLITLDAILWTDSNLWPLNDDGVFHATSH